MRGNEEAVPAYAGMTFLKTAKYVFSDGLAMSLPRVQPSRRRSLSRALSAGEALRRVVWLPHSGHGRRGREGVGADEADEADEAAVAPAASEAGDDLRGARGRGISVFLYKGVKRPAPVALRVLLHDVQHGGDKGGEDAARIFELAAVGGAGKGCAAVDDLVAQGVEAVEQHDQHAIGILCRQRGVRFLFGAGKSVLPRRLADFAVVKIPKGLEGVAVVQQRADAAGVGLPHQLVQQPFFVQTAHGLQKLPKIAALGRQGAAVDFLGIGGVESNPQRDKAEI